MKLSIFNPKNGLCRGRKGEKAPPALFVAEEEKEKRERNESLYRRVSFANEPTEKIESKY